jgi:hypothetical protein
VRDNKITDIYDDSIFQENIARMLHGIYYKNKSAFQDYAIDFDDFTQEIWCQFVEENPKIKDCALCMTIMKNDAMNYIAKIRRRITGVSLEEFNEDCVIG